MIIEILALITFVLILCLFFTLHKHGLAVEWFTNNQNCVNFRKHFEQENIMVLINFAERDVMIYLPHGESHRERRLTMYKAVKLYETTVPGIITKTLNQMK